MKLILGFLVIFFLYKCIFNSSSEVAEKPTYDVYYWKNFKADNPRDEIFIGTTDSAAACESLAMNYATQIHEAWNHRAYICLKTINGRRIKLRNGEPE